MLSFASCPTFRRFASCPTFGRFASIKPQATSRKRQAQEAPWVGPRASVTTPTGNLVHFQRKNVTKTLQRLLETWYIFNAIMLPKRYNRYKPSWIVGTFSTRTMLQALHNLQKAWQWWINHQFFIISITFKYRTCHTNYGGSLDTTFVLIRQKLVILWPINLNFGGGRMRWIKINVWAWIKWRTTIYHTSNLFRILSVLLSNYLCGWKVAYHGYESNNAQYVGFFGDDGARRWLKMWFMPRRWRLRRWYHPKNYYMIIGNDTLRYLMVTYQGFSCMDDLDDFFGTFAAG